MVGMWAQAVMNVQGVQGEGRGRVQTTPAPARRWESSPPLKATSRPGTFRRGQGLSQKRE